MDHPKVLVTGSDGRIGQAVVEELRAGGYPVECVDKAHRSWMTKIVDCEDLGQVISVMKGCQAVIHLAAIPSPLSHPPEVVFRTNVVSTYSVLEAASILGVKNVVLASSISALGTSFHIRHFNPQRVPIDESHPLLSQDAYGLSKMTLELLADGFARRDPDMALSSLRFAFVVDQPARDNFLMRFPEEVDERLRDVFWTYVDVRDAALACRLAMEAKIPGHEAYYINASRTLTVTPIEQLLAKYYPGDYPVAAHIRGDTCPFDSSKAGRLLGWYPRYDWRGDPFEA